MFRTTGDMKHRKTTTLLPTGFEVRFPFKRSAYCFNGLKIVWIIKKNLNFVGNEIMNRSRQTCWDCEIQSYKIRVSYKMKGQFSPGCGSLRR